jgi:hypothetical protein
MIYKEEMCNLLYYERALHKWFPLFISIFTLETLDFRCAMPEEYSKPCSVSLGDSMPAVLNTTADKKRPYRTSSLWYPQTIHCKKRLSFFPYPAGMSLAKLSLAGNNLIIPGKGEFD